MNTPIHLSDEVRQAIQDNRAMVALESSLISQGLPSPDNLEIALESEEILRNMGVVPATIAIHQGKAYVGLSREQIEWFSQDHEIAKVNLANLPIVLGRGQSGACTVSATLTLAAEARIAVMATGGIGGVHQDIADSMDISSDLTALAKCSIITVCAGAKAILALPQTLEALETLGVPVLGWKTRELPAFYSRESGCWLEQEVNTATEIVNIFLQQRALQLSQGILIGNPIPIKDEIPAREIQPWIEQALIDAKQEGIQGKQTTPYLLSRLKQISQQRTVRANLALIKNNVHLAGEIATELAKKKS